MATGGHYITMLHCLLIASHDLFGPPVSMVTDAMESTYSLLDQLHVHTHETEDEGIGSIGLSPIFSKKSPSNLQISFAHFDSTISMRVKST